MKYFFRVIVIVGIVLFLISQLFLQYNTISLMRDLDETMHLLSRDLSNSKEVKALIETAKEYGALQWQYDNSRYYIWASIIILILYVFYIYRKRKE